MENDAESGGSISSMSEIEDVEVVFEDALSPNVVIDVKPTSFRKYESEIDDLSNVYVSGSLDMKDQETNHLAYDQQEEVEIVELKNDKSLSSGRNYSLRTPRWSPRIKSVSHISDVDSQTEIKTETDHLVLVKEDEIKQEEELLNENDEHTHYCNDLQRSIFTEYPNLKIDDKFNFTSCSIKLEKIDFSHVTNSSPSEDTSENAPSPTRRRVRDRTAKKRVLLQNASRKKNSTNSRSKTATRSNSSVKGRRSSRLKQTTSDEKTKKSSPQKSRKRSAEYPFRNRSSSNISSKTRTGTAFSDSSEGDISSPTKSKKVRFMEAHGLTDRHGSLSMSRNNTNLNSSAKKKTVSFADTKGFDLLHGEKEKDPVEEYKKAIAKYSLEADTYKSELDSWFECLCCDRKYHSLAHCQVHVRGHFPGMLTN